MSAPAINPAIARQYSAYLEADERADKAFDLKRKALRKLVRVSGLGRKGEITVPISENRAIRIRNKWKKQEECFAPAFAKKFEVKELGIDQE